MIKLDPPCGFCGCRWVGDWGWPHFCKELIHGTPVTPTFTVPFTVNPVPFKLKSALTMDAAALRAKWGL